ncbi:uncharacterized protein LOC124311440 isoform X2 [Daphnia pulicaria]|nr:uncharacterized protein LOC124311440 isoform X2 [Daphnia pulicaria]
MDADFVFQKLFIGKAFLFCVCSAPNKYIQLIQKCQSSEEEIGISMDENECRLIGCEGLSSNCLKNVHLAHSKYEEKKQIAGFITTPSSAAPSKNFPTEIRAMLDASTKQGKPTSDDELVNHGVIRKGTHLTTRPGKRNRSPAIQETTDYKD